MDRRGTGGIASDHEAARWVPGWGFAAVTSCLVVSVLAGNFLLAVAILDKPYGRVLLAPILTLAAELKAELEAGSPVGEGMASTAALEKWRTRFRQRLAEGGFVLRGDGRVQDAEVEVSLASWAGRIIASSNPHSIGQAWSRDLVGGRPAAGAVRTGGGGRAAAEAGRPTVVRREGTYLVESAYQTATGKVRRLLLKLPGDAVQLSAVGLFGAHYRIGMAILAVGVGALALGLRLLRNRGAESGGGAARQTSLLVMGVALVCQLATSGLLLAGLARDYLTSARASTALLLDHAVRRIEDTAPEGPWTEGWSKLSGLLGDSLAGIPELEGATITAQAGAGGLRVVVARPGSAADADWVGEAAHRLVWLLGLEGHLAVQVPLRAREGTEGLLVAALSPSHAMKRVLASTFDSVMVLLISILFFVELLVILRHYVEAAGSTPAQRARSVFVLARPVAFFYVFGIDLSMSFLPIHMERLYRPLFGLSKDVVTGLPISTEFLSAGAAILAAGVWYDRRGWRGPLFVGLSLVTLGGLGSWLVSDALTFIASRALVGAGYGLALMASQGFVIGSTDSRTKAQGLAYLFAGLYAGSICGAATGGILAERYGYRATFLLGAVTTALVLPGALLFLRHTVGHLPDGAELGRAAGASVGRLRRFLCDRSVLALILFSSLPASIAVVGFLNYFSPLYLQRLGVSETTIGQLLVIYGICLIYCGPIIGRLADTAETRRAFIFIGCLVGAAAFLAFNALEGLLAVAVGILLMGLSHSLVLSSQSAYMLELEVTRELGQGMALGIFRASSRLGQMAGPIVFSFVAMSQSMRTSVGWLGGLYVLFALLFFLFTRPDRRAWRRSLPSPRLAGLPDRLAGETDVDNRPDS